MSILCRYLLLVAALNSCAQAAAAADETLPDWIWHADSRPVGDAGTVSRSFSIERTPTAATLKLAADFHQCSVVLNDVAIAELDDFAAWLELDVARFLRRGGNVILLRGRRASGPAAVALSLTIEFADGTSQRVLSNAQWPSESGQAASFGTVSAALWDASRTSRRITEFDDYTQWQQASRSDSGTAAPTFALRPGFEIERLRTATPEEGSWVSMAFDPEGRLTIGREDRGLLRFTLDRSNGVVTQVETINDALLECRGLLYAHGSLFVNANNSKALFRLRDPDGNGSFDDVKLLREFPGNVGHGRNDLALGPDGLIYSIHGDAVDVPTENVTDFTSPFRESRRGQLQKEGYLIRTDAEGARWELLAAGLRNPFGIDFNATGDVFTYDADAEFDMGAPWYRPTRIDQLVPGADFGWRGVTGQWPPYQLDRPDNALPATDIGKGSPTAVKFGRGSAFPAPYQDALFALDWAYGRILACHLTARGAGYTCRAETFLKGRPLNVTDLEFGRDGALYLITGGRQTESSLYRVRFTGTRPEPIPETPQQVARAEFSKQQRGLRQRLEQWLAPQNRAGSAADAADSARADDAAGSAGAADEAAVVSDVWPHLGSPDPMIRNAARVALEFQPVELWRQRSLAEKTPEIAATALLALARSNRPEFQPEILKRTIELPFAELSAFDRLSLLQAIELCSGDSSTVSSGVSSAASPAVSAGIPPGIATRLREWLDIATSAHSIDRATPPTGAGAGVVRCLTRLLARRRHPESVPILVGLLQRAESQEERMHFLFELREIESGWTLDDRRLAFAALQELEQTATGGDGMPGFLKRLRDELSSRVPDADRIELGTLLTPGSVADAEPIVIARPLVREWKPADIDELLKPDDAPRDVARGRALFDAIACSRCHRRGVQGGMIGPELTAVGSRFSRRDMLASILDPSLVVAEQFRSVRVVTQSGRTLTGRAAPGGDYRSPVLRLVTDPLDPSRIVEINKSEIEIHEPTGASPMPKSLLNTLNRAEILDLLAFLERQ